MRGAFLFWLLLIVTMKTTDSFPEDYILQVQATCAESDGEDDSAVITVMSDLEIYVDIYCADDFRVEVPTTDYVNHIAQVPYSGNSSDECVLQKMDNSATYKARVVIGYGDPGSVIHMYTDEYLITCTYDDNKGTNTSGTELQEGVLAPEDLQYNVGDAAQSEFDFEVTDVLGKPITGSIPLGKKIQLKTTMSDPNAWTRRARFGYLTLVCGPQSKQCDMAKECESYYVQKCTERCSRMGIATDEVSALAVGCKVVGAGKEYSILRGGCGDGVIFALDVGFHTKGKVIKSPFFQAFHMFGSDVVRFECNFTVCTTNCDGTSCFKETNNRRKRDVNKVVHIIIGHAETKSYRVERNRESMFSDFGNLNAKSHKAIVRHFTDDSFMDEALVVPSISNLTSEDKHMSKTPNQKKKTITKNCEGLVCRARGVHFTVAVFVIIYVTVFVLILIVKFKVRNEKRIPNKKDSQHHPESPELESVHM